MYITALKCSESKHSGFFVFASAQAAGRSTCLIHTARYTGLSVFHFTRGRCATLMRWHFEISFSLLPPNVKLSPLACVFTALRLQIDRPLPGRLVASRPERKFVHSLPSLTCRKRESLACGRAAVTAAAATWGRGPWPRQWKWQCQLNITFNFLVLWSPGC